ncbi:hypothetical protein [Nocardioides speluncae]|uniref:hypothetical protein n=1 Tax=Nocardioides speluncae TaxID=2670337 RepID=UPI000D699051|nr:hypothetical protein [Nocardioides speluncae]
MRRALVWVPFALVVALGLLVVGELVLRTAIPRELAGTVTAVDRRTEDQPGVDDVWFVTLDGNREVRVERPIGERLESGDEIVKTAWSRNLHVNDEEVRLSLSPEARASLWFVPLIWLLAGGLTLATTRPSEP